MSLAEVSVDRGSHHPFDHFRCVCERWWLVSEPIRKLRLCCQGPVLCERMPLPSMHPGQGHRAYTVGARLVIDSCEAPSPLLNNGKSYKVRNDHISSKCRKMATKVLSSGMGNTFKGYGGPEDGLECKPCLSWERGCLPPVPCSGDSCPSKDRCSISSSAGLHRRSGGLIAAADLILVFCDRAGWAGCDMLYGKRTPVTQR
jgi:hypothetical protein